MSDLFDEWGVDDGDFGDDLEDLEEDLEDVLDSDDLDDDDLDEDDELDDEDLDDDASGDDEVEDLDDDFASELAGSVEVSCPYCAAGVELIIDPAGGEYQEYVEDCEVCCQPWSVRVALDPEGLPSVDVSTLDDG